MCSLSICRDFFKITHFPSVANMLNGACFPHKFAHFTELQTFAELSGNVELIIAALLIYNVSMALNLGDSLASQTKTNKIRSKLTWHCVDWIVPICAKCEFVSD